MGNESYVDLHTHSWYSDGTQSPAALVQSALQHNVSTLAIADHDMLEGSRELLALCRNTSIRAIPAVEIDTYEMGINLHVLGYGVDLENPDFNQFVQQTRAALDSMNMVLITAMARDYPQLSVADVTQYTMPQGGGGWLALHYLLEKGVTSVLKEGVRFYQEYRCGYDLAGFPTIAQACDKIHAAGGKAVLAHPGEYVEISSDQWEMLVPYFKANGIDGMEAYYPTHSNAVRDMLLQLCRRHGLLITCGSDCHGTFDRTHVGALPMTLEMLVLDGIV